MSGRQQQHQPPGQPSKRRRTTQLAGAALLDAVLNKPEYRSSEDEDYAPQGPRAKASPGGKAATPRRKPAAAAAGQEEDLTLSERRRRLQQAQAQGPAVGPRSPASLAPGGGSVGPTQPSAHLPIEVVARVLQFAAASNAVPVIAAAACVCRTWRATVEQHPQLWRRVDLSHMRRQPSDVAVARFAVQRWGQLRYLSLSGCNKLSDATLKAVAQGCPMLSHLDLSYCTRFTEAGLTSALSVMLLRREGPCASPLRRLNLTCIQVTPRASGIDHLLREVLKLQQYKNESGPVLEELQMEGCPLLTHQGLRAICDASFELRRPLLGALRVLRLTQSAGARSNFALNLERLQYAAPGLEELGLNGLGGRCGWWFNQSHPPLPPYVPLGASRTAAGPGKVPGPAAAALAAAGGGAETEAAGSGEVPPGPSTSNNAIAAAIAQPAVAAAAAAAEAVGPAEAAGPAAAVGFPALRVCELGTTIIHAEGTLSGRSNLNDSALVRLISHSPLLEHLDLTGVDHVNPGALAAALHPVAPLRRVLLGRSSVCCDEGIVELARRHGDTLEAVDVSWGGPKVTDAAAQALARCPRLAALDLTGTAVSEAGVKALVAAAVERGTVERLTLDINSCRGLGREVRQAASQGMRQLQRVLGLP